jgi:uncharacterized repeat protein (TIGR03803 family)
MNMKGLLGKIAASFVFCLAGAVAASAQAPALSVLHSFSGSPSDGSTSVAPLILDTAGNLYGTTAGGGNATCGSTGSSGCGTVFKVDSSGNETLLHQFSGSDGAFPAGGLVMDAAGNLYGTTVSGGSGGLCKNSGCGTVFKIDSAGNFTLLHAFTETSTDGGNPTAGLILDSSNHLYGTTGFGGASGTGTVFMMDTTGSNVTLLHSFVSTDGTEPSAPLIMDSAGNLYSTTFSGGAGGVGTVFELNIASGNFKVLHAFNLSTDGGYSSAPVVMDSANNLYGTTAGNGTGGSYGALFKIDNLGNFSVLHAFTGSADGGYLGTEGRPAAGLVFDPSGNLYGTTASGGAPVSQTSTGGTIFEYSAGSLTTLYTFYCTFTGCPDGVYPSAGLVEDAGGNFYGTTTSSGSAGGGTIFKLAVQAQTPPALTSISPNSAMVGGLAFTLTVNGTGFVSGSTVNFNGSAAATTFVSSTELTATITASDIAVAGSYNITVTNPGNEVSNAVSFTVTGQASQTIAFGPLANQFLGTAPFPVSATATSGLPVNLASLTPAVCTVLGNTVTLVSAGTCTIEATQPGNTTYAPAQSVDRSFQVQRVSQQIAFANLPNRILGAAPFTVSATATSGLPVSFASLTPGVCMVSGNTVTLASAGTCIIEASQPGNTTYAAAQPVDRSFQVAKALTSMALTASPGPYVSGVPITFTARITSSFGPPPDGETVTFRSGSRPGQLCSAKLSGGVATCTTSALAVGMDSVTASYAGDSNFAGSTATVRFQIAPPPKLHVTATAAVGVSTGFGFPPFSPQWSGTLRFATAAPERRIT